MLKPTFLNHRNIYLFGLVLLAIGLPVSVFLMSISQFILIINWIWEGNLISKWQKFKSRPALIVFILLFLIHVLGLIWTTWPEGFFGHGYNGLKDLRLKLPLLIIPFVVGTSKRLNFRELKAVLYFFSASVFVSTIISLVVYLGFTNHTVNTNRDISIFISHIRFALLINISIFSLAYLCFRKGNDVTKSEKLISLVSIVWFIFFFIILQSVTGIVVFLLSIFVIAISTLIRLTGFWFRFSILGTIAVSFIWLVYFLIQTYAGFFTIQQTDYKNPKALTANGNVYVHNFEDQRLENGWFMGLYICEKELRENWNRLGTIPFDEKDKSGQEIKYTLMRYMTSKGLRKDSVGVSKLDSLDIRLITEGKASVIYRHRFSIMPRLYEVFWEIKDYSLGGNPSGHSVTQRYEYLRAGLAIISDNFWLGVGTGDVKIAFDRKYEELNSSLYPEFRHRAHNQFITFFIAFGLIGFSLLLFCIIYPIIKEKGWKQPLFMIFFFIAMVSMLNEDTLETQPGVTFFTFFYVLFLFGYSAKSESQHT
jgi:hypothetical protein